MHFVGSYFFLFLEDMVIEMKERAICYFRLGEQYFETAKLLLETLINNKNSNAGIGNTAEEAQCEMEHNALKSDLYLFIPAVFNCLQSTELFVKGLLLLNGKTFEKKHSVEELLEFLMGFYGVNSELYYSLRTYYDNQIDIIKNFMKTNHLTNSHDLYMSLRYPEITLKSSKYGGDLLVDYMDLMCNGDVGIKQFKLLLSNLYEVKEAILKVYNAGDV